MGDPPVPPTRENPEAGRKTLGYRKTKTYFDTPSKWLKRMIKIRDQENVFVFEFGLKCLR